MSEIGSDHYKIPTFISRDGCTLYFSMMTAPSSAGLLVTAAQYVAQKPR